MLLPACWRCVSTLFWKYVNPICGSIGQLIQDRLLSNDFLNLLQERIFSREWLTIVYRAIVVYLEDKKTKDEIKSYYDN